MRNTRKLSKLKEPGGIFNAGGKKASGRRFTLKNFPAFRAAPRIWLDRRRMI